MYVYYYILYIISITKGCFNVIIIYPLYGLLSPTISCSDMKGNQ